MTWTMHFRAPDRLLNANDRQHWAPTAAAVRSWRHAARIYATAAKFPRGLSRVRIDITVHFPDRRRRDRANWYPTAKPITDGLTDYGVVCDDSDDYVDGPVVTIGEPTTSPVPEVTVTITDLSAAGEVA